jgi:hypothetical protein
MHSTEKDENPIKSLDVFNGTFLNSDRIAPSDKSDKVNNCLERMSKEAILA